MANKDFPNPNNPEAEGRRWTPPGTQSPAKLAGPIISVWERLRGQGTNLVGVALTASILVLSTALVKRDKEILSLRQQLEQKQAEKEHLKTLRDAVLNELALAGNGKDGVQRVRSKVEALFAQHFPDLK